EKDVALLDLVVRDALEQRLKPVRDRPADERDVLLSLSNELTSSRADRSAEVAALADDRRESELLDHDGHLVDDGGQGTPQDFERDRVEPHRFVSITRLPRPSIVARERGGRSVVESNCSTTAGPSTVAPGR